MAAFGILRQYNDDYLREIGQPGTRGRPVFGIRGGQYAGLLRAEFETTAACDHAGMSAWAPFVSRVYGEETYEEAADSVQVSLSNQSQSSRQTRADRRYRMPAQGTEPAAFGCDPLFQLVGEARCARPGWDADDVYYAVELFVEVSVLDAWQPWWGRLDQAPGAGYAAREGRWALLCLAAAYVTYSRHALPDCSDPPDIWHQISATGRFWAYSRQRFHRLRASRRDFVPADEPEWERAHRGQVPGGYGPWRPTGDWPAGDAVAADLGNIAWSAAIGGELSIQNTGASAPY